MLAFDRDWTIALNAWAHRRPPLDHLAVELGRNDLLKGGLVLGMFWWQWFRLRPDMRLARGRLLAALTSGFVALLLGRVLAVATPFRVRPLHEPALHLVRAYGLGADTMRTWSSFPSDHAMLFGALSAGLAFVSPRGGLVLLVFTSLVVGLPRVFLGYHYPSDLVAGGLFGVLVAVALQWAPLRERLARPLLAWLERDMASFYAAMFLVTFQIATMFDDLRALVALVLHALHPGGAAGV